MPQDDQAKYRVGETLTDSLAALNRNRGRVSRRWLDLTSVERETEADRIQLAIDDGVYTPLSDYAEGRALEAAVVNVLLDAEVGSELRFTQQPSAADEGVVIAPDVTVSLTDADGNVITGFVGDVTIAKATGSGILSGTLVQPAVAGVATFDDLEIDDADDYTLIATVGTLSVTSDEFTISV